MAYLAPAEFVTKMVDAGESKLLMSTRDTLIRAYMAGANQWMDFQSVPTADAKTGLTLFLASNGNWATAIARRQANLTHIVDRFHESVEFEKSIKALWEKSLAGGLFSDDMPGRVYFAGVLLPNYVNSSKQAPFRGINFIYALNALARATNRKPDAFEEWILGDWERYRRQYNVADILANRQVFAQFEASLPTVRGAGWDATMVLDLLKQAYQTRRLPWT